MSQKKQNQNMRDVGNENDGSGGSEQGHSPERSQGQNLSRRSRTASLENRSSGKPWIWLGSFIVVMLVIGSVWATWGKDAIKEAGIGSGKTIGLQGVASVSTVKDTYDLIVVGTDPEGIAAAISAARNGLQTLLIDSRDREIFGGLFTLGWLNTIDMSHEPGTRSIMNNKRVLNRGLFSEWFDKVEGDSFDVITAANAFNEMVANESLIDVLMKNKAIEPLVRQDSNSIIIEGVKITKADGSTQEVRANAVIDATQDGDIAVAAGVPYTYGREDLGDKNSKMAVTLVFRLKNVTPDVWNQIRQRLTNDNDPNTGANDVSAWGYSEMYQYQEINTGNVKMRGLNIGRQNNNTILINALHIFDIDGSDPADRARGLQIGREEVPHVVKYMRETFPEFANVELDATAPELYVRETRHILGEYRLNIIDVLENRDQWDRIAFGSYDVDIQRSSVNDYGAVVVVPDQFAVPFRSIVPLKVDGLLVIGRAASFDSLPHGSARTVPIGMAVGQSAAVAVKLAAEQGVTFREMSASEQLIADLQQRLNEQGMVIKPFQLEPEPYMLHRSYEGLKVAVSLAIAYGGYSNDFDLDGVSNTERVVNQISGVRKVNPSAFPGMSGQGLGEVVLKHIRDAGKEPNKEPVTIEQAAYTIAIALGFDTTINEAPATLEKNGYLTKATIDHIENKQQLTNGDVYMLIKDLYGGLVRE